MKVGRWGMAAIILAVPLAGYWAAQAIQPERFAAAAACLTRDDSTVSNACSEALNIVICPLGSTETGCLPTSLAPHQTFGLETEDFVAACREPYLPAYQPGLLNLSIREWGCAPHS